MPITIGLDDPQSHSSIAKNENRSPATTLYQAPDPYLSLPTIEALILRLSRRFFPPISTLQAVSFYQQYNNDSALVAKVGLILGECLYLAFYFWDRVVDLNHSTQALAIRLFIASWFFILTIVPRPFFRRNLQTLMTPSIILAGVGVVAIITIEKDGLTVGVGGVVLVLMFNFGFFRLLFLPSFISGVLICISYNIAAFTASLDTQRIIANNFFLLSALISGSSITYLLERLFRTRFLIDASLHRERIALSHQLMLERRYLDWLRRLAAFLRHEVRNPIAKITSSIELITLVSGQDERLLPHVRNATLGVQDVLTLVERASRATDAEAFVRQSQPQTIDVTPLVTQLVEDYQRTHSDIFFRLGGDKAVTLFVDQTLLREAIGNLLANAASFATAYTTIHIGIKRSEDVCAITVTNTGPLITVDADTLFGAFTSTRAATCSEHHGLGLYLVRLVAEHYNGRARLRTLEDNSGVEASIELPVI